jgi:formylglycine-generating enzyme required for sulfatase activity
MLFRALLICVLVLACAVDAVAQSTRRVALVIGNGAYQHTSRLANPANDARRMAELLRGAGVEVILGIDLDRRAVDDRLRQFRDRLDGGSLGILFYAGHGLQVEGENYLLPVDARLQRQSDLEFEALSVTRVLRIMEDAAPTRLVFLDACRDNPLAQTLARGMGTRSSAIGRGLGVVTAGRGTMVSFATQPGNVALDGAGENSPFTAALLRHLAEPGVDVGIAMRRVREAVLRATGERQVPWEHSSLLGEVVLVPAAVSTPVAPGVAAPAAPVAPAVAVVPPAPDRDVVFWQSIQNSQRAEEFEAYLRQFPQGTFADLARARIAALRAPPPPAPQPQPAVGVWPQGSGYPVPVGQAFRDCPECPEMMVIPSGSFRMGSPAGEADRRQDEGPQRQVTVRAPLAVGRFEVTFREWDACVAAGGCSHRPSDEGWGRGNRPVIHVSWNDAQQYVGWLSRRTGQRYRLLTEAEWEYAARAGTTTPWHTGGSIGPSQAVFGSSRTEPVGSRPANRFGLRDMHGNVWEWVEDCYRDSYAGAPLDASQAVSTGGCASRVRRGGSWYNSPRILRSANRNGYTPGDRFDVSGFRVARTPGG